MGKRLTVATFEGVGGPAKLQQGSGDKYWAGPTDPGIYRMARCGKHSSGSYPEWSKIRWNSEIKEVGGNLEVKHDGRWQSLKSVSPRITKDILIARNLQLYGKNELPSRWLFNDFGHVTCYFFKDKNDNGKLDGKEDIHLEYFHTTPDDEAATAAGKPVTLSESHGCIHVKPNDIDTMIEKGYFKGGNRVVVHKYDETLPRWESDSTATAPFEVHFFPGQKKIVVTGTRLNQRTR